MLTFGEYLILEEINKSLMEKLSEKIKIPKKDETYKMNLHDAKIAFKILNKEIFLSKLKECEIVIENFDPKKHIVSDKNTIIGDYQLILLRDSLIDFYDSNFKDYSLIKAKYKIYLVNGVCNIHFADFISILAHEMIHEYDYLYGQGKIGMILNKFDELSNKKKSYDEHGTYFKDKATYIRKNYNIKVNTEFTMDTESKEIPICEQIDKIIEGIDETDTLQLNDCKDEKIVKIAKLLRRSIKDSGLNRISILPNGDISITGV